MTDQPTTPPSEPDGPGRAPTEAGAEDEQNRAAFFPIGLVFLVLGLMGFANDSMRYASFAFLPVGVVFLILAAQGRSGGAEDAAPAAEPPGSQPGPGPAEGPDVTPR
ncbi:DUF3784 domain-containing protein [Cellulomonas pakistanensis]|uniref:Uncharacterized protein n=1 Tax=Cellulomonas pakistanensis TaxID=992287 RepID=A0A919U1D0_9CELL|nr:DUF3784 domain-containing protein [Cellulomonas pakistanensis]GIG34748.1 hypothetical protein Cpa01nite_01290 [Cellulomonas pakistanensis]